MAKEEKTVAIIRLLCNLRTIFDSALMQDQIEKQIIKNKFNSNYDDSLINSPTSVSICSREEITK